MNVKWLDSSGQEYLNGLPVTISKYSKALFPQEPTQQASEFTSEEEIKNVWTSPSESVHTLMGW